MADDNYATPASTTTAQPAASDLSHIDTTLEDNPAADFKSDTTMPNIWTIDDDDDDTSSREEPKHEVVTSHNVDEELEKPSFLRRLAKRYRDNPDSDKSDQNDDLRTK
jgi:hypothetical protein